MTCAGYRVPIGGLINGARFEGGQDEAAKSFVPRLRVDLLVDATDLLCWEARQYPEAARKSCRERMLFRDQRVVQQDFANG